MPVPEVKRQHNVIPLDYIDSRQSEAISAVRQGEKTGVLMVFITVEKNPNTNFMSKCFQQAIPSEHLKW